LGALGFDNGVSLVGETVDGKTHEKIMKHLLEPSKNGKKKFFL